MLVDILVLEMKELDPSSPIEALLVVGCVVIYVISVVFSVFTTNCGVRVSEKDIVTVT